MARGDQRHGPDRVEAVQDVRSPAALGAVRVPVPLNRSRAWARTASDPSLAVASHPPPGPLAGT